MANQQRKPQPMPLPDEPGVLDPYEMLFCIREAITVNPSYLVYLYNGVKEKAQKKWEMVTLEQIKEFLDQAEEDGFIHKSGGYDPLGDPLYSWVGKYS